MLNRKANQMTRNDKIQKADRIAANIISKKPDMSPEFAKACAAYMVLTNQYKLSQVRMPVFLAGERGYDKFVAQF
jgi:hypothetical protein